MWFYIPAAIFLVLFAIWFSRTNTFRHQFRGNGKIPGQRSQSRRALLRQLAALPAQT